MGIRNSMQPRLTEMRGRRRPRTTSRWAAAAFASFAVWWGFLGVRAALAGVWWLAIADGLLCLLSIWAAVGVLRRRRASSDS